MNCPNCGYKMRFVGGKWGCDACTQIVDAPPDPPETEYEGADALDNADSLTIVRQIGRALHGNRYHEDDAALTDAQRGRLALLDAEIAEALSNYRSEVL